MFGELALPTYVKERPRALGAVSVLVRVEDITLNKNPLRVLTKGGQVLEKQVRIVS